MQGDTLLTALVRELRGVHCPVLSLSRQVNVLREELGWSRMTYAQARQLSLLYLYSSRVVEVRHSSQVVIFSA